MIQGMQRSAENDGPNKQEITDILYDQSKTDSGKIAMMQSMFSKENDLNMAKGILNDTSITSDEKVQILSALYQLARNERDEMKREMDNVYAGQVSLENEWKTEIRRSKKEHFENLNTEYSKMLDSAKRKATAVFENRMLEVEADIEREKLLKQEELEELMRQRKLDEIQETVAALQLDRTELKTLIQKDIIDELQAKLNEVKEIIAEADASLAELTQQSEPESEPEEKEVKTSVSIATTLSDISDGLLHSEAKDYLAINYSGKPITNQRIIVTDFNNKYIQVNVNDGEYYITFDSTGRHLWTNGPFESPIQKKKVESVKKTGNVRIIRETVTTIPVKQPRPDSDTPEVEVDEEHVVVNEQNAPAQVSDESEAPEPIAEKQVVAEVPTIAVAPPVTLPQPTTTGLVFNPIDEGIYKPSDVVSNIFSEINREVRDDNRSRSRTVEKYYLGYTADEIRNDIIKRGVADFTTGYKDDITAYDKVLLYCYFNMKKHVCTSCQFYDSIGNLDKYFEAENKHPMLIDLGCGPVTSLLAMADLIKRKTGRRVKMNYVGIDNSIEMMQRGDKIIRNSFLLSDEADVQFYENWNDSTAYIKSKLADTNVMLFNASYLFASNSLNENELARFVVGLTIAGIDTIFLNQNPPIPELNQKFENFKQIVSNFNLVLEQDATVSCLYSQSDKYEPKEANVRFTILKRNG